MLTDGYVVTPQAVAHINNIYFEFSLTSIAMFENLNLRSNLRVRRFDTKPIAVPRGTRAEAKEKVLAPADPPGVVRAKAVGFYRVNDPCIKADPRHRSHWFWLLTKTESFSFRSCWSVNYLYRA